MLNALIIFCAEYLYLLVIFIAIAYFFTVSKNQKKAFILLAVIALPCIYAAAKIAGYFYFDPRPFVVGHFMPLIPHASDNGFPSDHALLTGAIASVVFFFNKKISAVLWLLVIIIGAARVAAGIHHALDIAGAIAIAIVIASVANRLLKSQLSAA